MKEPKLWMWIQLAPTQQWLQSSPPLLLPSKEGSPGKWDWSGALPQVEITSLLQAEKQRGNSSNASLWQWSRWWNSAILSLHSPKWDKPTGYVLMTAKRTQVGKWGYWVRGALSPPLFTQFRGINETLNFSTGGKHFLHLNHSILLSILDGVLKIKQANIPWKQLSNRQCKTECKWIEKFI